MRLDPRTKLLLILLANVLLFLRVNNRLQIPFVLLLLLAFWLAGQRRRCLIWSAVYALLWGIDLLLLPVAQGFLLSTLTFFAISLRLFFPSILAGLLALKTTTISAFVAALRRLKIPESLVIPCMVILRFFPTIWEDYRQIQSALSFRGFSASKQASCFRPVRKLEYVLVPLLMNSQKVSEDLAMAALTKGLALPGKHSSLTELRLVIWDYAYMLLASLPLVCFVWGVR